MLCMRVTVCQLSDDPPSFAADWARLRTHVEAQKSELVLLPEMPFSTWFATEREFAPELWGAAIAEHERWKGRLSDLAPATVLSTEPVERQGRRLNEAFIWSAGRATPAHHKRYLPDEAGFWEASWYQRGDGAFDLADAAGARVGFQICTELWTLEASRKYGLAGADIIAAPRATPASSVERWVVAGRSAAMLAGAFCLSSNRAGASKAGFQFGGAGWIIGPDGDVLALTSEAEPIITRTIDLADARAAKSTYPRYVR
jgi:N-carbamoylputrescine amidase